MKIIWITLSIIGFIAPNLLVAIESYETGNLLLWLDPEATINGMFNNRISSAFIIDLLVVVGVFFFWTYYESKKHAIRNVWIIWVLTMLFGMAGTLPLFLYMKENQLSKGTVNN